LYDVSPPRGIEPLHGYAGLSQYVDEPSIAEADAAMRYIFWDHLKENHGSLFWAIQLFGKERFLLGN
jgi:hypothetical protein